MTVFETIPVRSHYGAIEINGIDNMEEVLASLTGEVYWSDPNLNKVFRFRVLSDSNFPFYDVSYCYGTLKNGENVRVSLPFHQLRKARWKSELIEWAKRDGVFAKALGFFDPMVFSTVR